MRRFWRLFLLGVFFLAMGWPAPAFAALNLDKLSEGDIQLVKKLLNDLDPLIKQRDEQHTLATLTFEELYEGLPEKEKRFLQEFQDLDAKKLGVRIPFRGIATGEEPLVMLTGQKVKVRDKKKEGTDKDVRELPPQFLPPEVFVQYKKMIKAMKREIGKRLFVESAYRSSAYQLYLLVYYLKNHDYSIRETVKFVALPGYSEHGSPEHQALDFINPDGINGEDNPKEFEDLPEYKWLLEHAGEYGFVLSYPKRAASGITYEPWHWRYEKSKKSDIDILKIPSSDTVGIRFKGN